MGHGEGASPSSGRPSDEQLEQWVRKVVAAFRRRADLSRHPETPQWEPAPGQQPTQIDRGGIDELDYLQAARVAAWKARDEYDPDKAGPGGWRGHIYKAMQYAILNLARAGRRQYGIRIVRESANKSKEQREHDEQPNRLCTPKGHDGDAAGDPRLLAAMGISPGEPDWKGDICRAEHKAKAIRDRAWRSETRARVRWTLGALTPAVRTLLSLVMAAPEATREELADAAGMSVRTWDRRLSEARQAFIERWNETASQDPPASAWDLLKGKYYDEDWQD